MLLDDRQRAGCDGDREQRPDAGHEGLQPPVPPALPLEAPLALVPARLDELVLDGVELPGVAGLPVEHGRESRAAVEVAGIASAVDPLAGRSGDMGSQPSRLGLLLEPLPHPRPFAEERLVRDLDCPVVGGHEPCVHENGEDAGDIVPPANDLVGRRPAAAPRRRPRRRRVAA